LLAAAACGSSGGSGPSIDAPPAENQPTFVLRATPTASPNPTPTAMPSPTAEVTAEPIGTVEERIAALVPALMDEGFKVSQSNRIDELWGTLLVGIGDEILGTATRGFANEEEAIEHSPDAVWPLVGMTDLFTVVGIL